MERATKRQLKKKLISRKNGASEEAIFFQTKKRNTDVIFQAGRGGEVSPNKNGAAK